MDRTKENRGKQKFALFFSYIYIRANNTENYYLLIIKSWDIDRKMGKQGIRESGFIK